MLPREWENLDIAWRKDRRPVIRREDMLHAVQLYMQDAPCPLLLELPSGIPGFWHVYLAPNVPFVFTGRTVVDGWFYVGQSTALGVPADSLAEVLQYWWGLYSS